MNMTDEELAIHNLVDAKFGLSGVASYLYDKGQYLDPSDDISEVLKTMGHITEVMKECYLSMDLMRERIGTLSRKIEGMI